MEPEHIRTFFRTIANEYDKANAIMSFGLHWQWNRKLAKAVSGAEHLLDLCAGTGEIAFTFLKSHPHSKAILLDFCLEMLECAKKKGQPFANQFEVIEADAQAIPYSNATFDAVTVAYGIRNVNTPEKCFREAHRVLKTGGRLAILELTRPSSRILYQGHRLYLRFLIPTLGKIVTHHKEAYSYLARSISTFADPVSISKNLKEVGFQGIQIEELFGGVATLIVAEKT